MKKPEYFENLIVTTTPKKKHNNNNNNNVDSVRDPFSRPKI